MSCNKAKDSGIYTLLMLQIIFGTGDTLKAVTLTANEAFVRAAAHQVMSLISYIIVHAKIIKFLIVHCF